MSVAELHAYIRSFSEWVETHAAPLLQVHHASLLDSWREELASAGRLLDEKPELPIALLGPSQQGKSSLINAMVGETILPVGAAVGACTCVVTSVHYDSSDKYRAEIEFISLKEWASELFALKAAADAVASEEDVDADREEQESQKAAALEKFDAVYRDKRVSEIETILENADLLLPREIALAMSTGQPIAIVEDKPISLRNGIRKYLVGRQQHQDGQFWPLISRLRIYGKFDILSNGVELVDLPGLNDPNPAREQVTKRYLKDAQYIWLVRNSQSGIDRVFSHLLRDDCFLLRLFLEGRLDVFSVIATKVDDINLQAILELMGKDVEDYDGNYRPVLEYRRKEIEAHARDRLASIAEEIVSKANPHEHAAAFFDRIRSIPVFSISTAAYSHAIGKSPLYTGMKLSEEESQIPDLIEHMHSITLARSYKTRVEASFRRLQLLYTQANRFFLDRIRRAEADTALARAEWSEFVRVATGSLNQGQTALDEIKGCAAEVLHQHRVAFDERLTELESAAEKNLGRVFSRWDTINWRTLRAALEKNGVWYSVALGREFDLNRDLARAYLDLVPLIWDDYFGAQLAGLTDQVVNDTREELRRTVERIKGAISMLRHQPQGLQDSIETSLATASDSFKLRVGEVRARLAAHIQRTRQELASGVVESAQEVMRPAYSLAANDRGGAGTKKRMLALIANHARLYGPRLFLSIGQELAEGVGALEASMIPQLTRIVTYGAHVLDQSRQNTINHQVVGSDQLGAFRSALSQFPRAPIDESTAS